MTTENPYSAPATDPTVASFDGQLQLATLGQRFVGALIDGLISAVIVVPIGFALGLYSTTAGPKPGLMATTVMGLVGFAVFVAIHWVFLNATGQTIGKKVAKTRIVTMDGEKPGMGDLVGKRYAFMNLIGLIPLLGGIVSLVNILFIFRKDRRCLHDLIGGTQVVQMIPGQPIL